MTHGVYRVTGRRRYRGHQPGSTFEARLEAGPERRAIARGDIELLRRFTPTLPGNHRFPQGWLDPAAIDQPTGAAKAAFLIQGGK